MGTYSRRWTAKRFVCLVVLLCLSSTEVLSAALRPPRKKAILFDFENGIAPITTEDPPGKAVWKVESYEDFGARLNLKSGKIPRPKGGGGDHLLYLDIETGASIGSFFKTPWFKAVGDVMISFEYYLRSSSDGGSGIQVYYLEEDAVYQVPLIILYNSTATNEDFFVASDVIPAGTAKNYQVWIYGNGNINREADIIAIDNIMLQGNIEIPGLDQRIKNSKSDSEITNESGGYKTIEVIPVTGGTVGPNNTNNFGSINDTKDELAKNKSISDATAKANFRKKITHAGGFADSDDDTSEESIEEEENLYEDIDSDDITISKLPGHLINTDGTIEYDDASTAEFSNGEGMTDFTAISTANSIEEEEGDYDYDDVILEESKGNIDDIEGNIDSDDTDILEKPTVEENIDSIASVNTNATEMMKKEEGITDTDDISYIVPPTEFNHTEETNKEENVDSNAASIAKHTKKINKSDVTIDSDHLTKIKIPGEIENEEGFNTTKAVQSSKLKNKTVGNITVQYTNPDDRASENSTEGINNTDRNADSKSIVKLAKKVNETEETICLFTSAQISGVNKENKKNTNSLNKVILISNPDNCIDKKNKTISINNSDDTIPEKNIQKIIVTKVNSGKNNSASDAKHKEEVKETEVIVMEVSSEKNASSNTKHKEEIKDTEVDTDPDPSTGYNFPAEIDNVEGSFHSNLSETINPDDLVNKTEENVDSDVTSVPVSIRDPTKETGKEETGDYNNIDTTEEFPTAYADAGEPEGTEMPVVNAGDEILNLSKESHEKYATQPNTEEGAIDECSDVTEIETENPIIDASEQLTHGSKSNEFTKVKSDWYTIPTPASNKTDSDTVVPTESKMPTSNAETGSDDSNQSPLVMEQKDCVNPIVNVSSQTVVKITYPDGKQEVFVSNKDQPMIKCNNSADGEYSSLDNLSEIPSEGH